MKEIETIKWQLERYRAILVRQVDRLYNALEELQRTTILLTEIDIADDDDIDNWLQAEGFAVDDDGFFQNRPLLSSFRKGRAPEDAVSCSWGGHLKNHSAARRDMYRHRNIGPHLKHIHDRLEDIGWIYYQSVHNVSLQYPYIDQTTAITSDFDWSSYHTYVSVSPANNPERKITWTSPSIDYAGEGLIIAVSIPVWHRDAFVGLWSIDLPIRYLYRDFAASKTHPEQSKFIVNREGMFLLHEKLNAEIDQSQGRIIMHSLSELGGGWARTSLDNIIAEKSDSFEIKDASGEPWIFCFSRISGVEWILFSGLPRSSMEEAASQRLRQAFEQVAAGNFSHRIERPQANALPILVDAFNEMSLRLCQAEKKREEMESQLRQAQKLEAIGRLAGGVAHDYNNITNVIMGYSEMALEEITKNDPFHNYFDEIHKAAHRSKELTRQLLAFARRQSIDPQVLEINQAIEELIKMLNRMIGEDIQLVWRPGEGIWPIKIDPSQLDQILTNLCVNARDAISSVGKIVIETANIEFDQRYCAIHQEFVPGEFVQLAVTDDGKGMDKETLEKIFEPFFSTKAVGRGTGLGLATVYGIVKQNNGFINVYSEPERGSCFKIYLPRAKGKAVKTIFGNPAEIPFGHGETLLLVEDEPALLSLAAHMLNDLGYRTLTADSPEKAIVLAEKHPEIDLLVTDVIMPRITGRDLADRLQTIFPGLGVVYMSGYTADVIAHRGILEKSVLVIQKPFSKKHLALKISKALSQSDIGRRRKET